jgi:hypothetical protein
MPRGSGRTKGAVSFVSVNLRELNRILKEDAQVLVSRRYAEQLCLKGRPVGINAGVLKSHVEDKAEEQIKIKIEEPKPIPEYTQ